VPGLRQAWFATTQGSLRYADAVPAPVSTAGYLVGVLRLAAALLFATAAILLAAGREAWRAVALAAVAVSASVIGPAPAQAVAGLALVGDRGQLEPGPGRGGEGFSGGLPGLAC